MEMVDILNTILHVDQVRFGIKKFRVVTMHGRCQIVAVHKYQAIVLQVNGNRLEATHKALPVHQAIHGKNNNNPVTHNHNSHLHQVKVAAGTIIYEIAYF